MTHRAASRRALVASLLASSCCQRAKPAAAVDAGLAAAPTAPTPNPSTDTVCMCPMDKDIRAHEPGKCPRCGMTLVDRASPSRSSTTST